MSRHVNFTIDKKLEKVIKSGQKGDNRLAILIKDECHC